MPPKPTVIPKKRPPGFALLLFLAAIALIVFIVLLVRLPSGDSGRAYQDEASATRLMKRRTFTFDETRDMALVGNRLAKLRTDQFFMYSVEGEEVAQENINYDELGWTKKGRDLLIGDRGTVGQTIYYFNENGLLWQNTLEGSFAKADIGQNVVAVIDEVNAGFPVVHLMNRDSGQLRYRLSFAESGHAVDLGLTPSESALDVLLLNTRTSRSKVILKRYDLEGGQMAQRIPEGLDEFFYGLEHQGSQLVIYAPTRIVSLDYQGDEFYYDLNFAEVKWVEARNKTCLAMVREEEGGNWKLLKIAQNGATQTLLDTADNLTQVLAEEGGTALAIGTELYLYDWSKDRLKNEVTLPDEALSLGFDGRSTLYIMTATAVYELALN